MAELTPTRQARRDRLIGVAHGAFLESGYSGVTMEGLAQAAGVSKVTLYGYFTDKSEVYKAVAEAIASQITAGADSAFSEDHPPADRLLAALKFKHGLVFDLVRMSEHAGELFTHKGLAGEAIAAMNARFDAQAADAVGPLARLILPAAQGIANAATDRDQLLADLDVLVRNLAG